MSPEKVGTTAGAPAAKDEGAAPQGGEKAPPSAPPARGKAQPKRRSKGGGKSKTTAHSAPPASVKQRPDRPLPRDSLSEAVRVPLALKEYNGGNAWPPLELRKVIDQSIENETITSNYDFYLTAASRDFGLTLGTRDAAEISLTELGREFAYAGTPAAEKAALQKAFFNVDIFKRVFDHYGGGDLPEQKFVANTLEGTFGLDPSVHAEFLTLCRENLHYLGSDLRGASPAAQGSRPPAIAPVIPDAEDVVTIAEPDEPTDKTCFVAIPFSERERPKGFFMEVLQNLIGPAGAKAGFRVITANRKGTDVIQSTIVNSLFDADLAVVDLTDHNPNVLFELGVRMAIDKPVALLRAEGTGRIFDVDNMLRVFDYSANLWKSTIDADLPNMTAHIKASWDRRDSERTYIKILRAGVKLT